MGRQGRFWGSIDTCVQERRPGGKKRGARRIRTPRAALLSAAIRVDFLLVCCYQDVSRGGTERSSERLVTPFAKSVHSTIRSATVLEAAPPSGRS